MEPNAREPEGEDELRIPERLQDELAALRARPVSVPESMNRAILAAAEARAAEIRRASGTAGRARIVRLVRWAAAAAACLALAVGAAWLLVPGWAFARADLNRDGRVDVLDAFLLARRLEAKETAGRECDLNGDGRVDRKDVDAIAMIAVRLPAGGAR